MPRIWTDSIESHRQQVHDAILAATADLAAEHGPLALAMSTIADRAGIGRATLYKYFPDLESILLAWHKREFTRHLEGLKRLSQDPEVTLQHLATFIADLRRRLPHFTGGDVVGNLAQTVAQLGDPDGHEHGEQLTVEVTSILSGLLAQLARRKQVRRDHSPEALARWLLHAVHAPASLDPSTVAELVSDSLAPRRTSPRASSPQPGGTRRAR
jgi:AcrR family transcriptional regulator